MVKPKMSLLLAIVLKVTLCKNGLNRSSRLVVYEKNIDGNRLYQLHINKIHFYNPELCELRKTCLDFICGIHLFTMKE